MRRKNEDSIWMGWARNQGLRRHDERRPGHRHQRRDARATASTSSRTALVIGESSPGRANDACDQDANAGVDVFYNPTPGLRADLTVNTDFAQTEVDQRQVNLTRFSLFFPEKRDFFLDGATVLRLRAARRRRRH